MNWADLGTKSLTGQRINDLLSIMPLCRRGLVVACLLCGITGAKAQSEQEGSAWNFLLYMLIVHLLALITAVWGTISMCRAKEPQKRCEDHKRLLLRKQIFQAKKQQVQDLLGHGGGPRLRTSQALASLSQDRVYVIGNGERYHKRTCGTAQRKPSERRFT